VSPGQPLKDVASRVLDVIAEAANVAYSFLGERPGGSQENQRPF
jgi:hypothetical protein